MDRVNSPSLLAAPACPASTFCSCIRRSVPCTAHDSHLHVLMRLVARVSSCRCYPRTVSFHLLKAVHPLRGLACLQGHVILHSVPAAHWATVVIQTKTLLPPRSPGGLHCECRWHQCVFTHRGADHQDVLVHFAKRQLVKDLCFSRCLKPKPTRSLSRSCQPIAPVFLMLRVSQHAVEAGPRLSPRINRRMRCSDESS